MTLRVARPYKSVTYIESHTTFYVTRDWHLSNTWVTRISTWSTRERNGVICNRWLCFRFPHHLYLSGKERLYKLDSYFFTRPFTIDANASLFWLILLLQNNNEIYCVRDSPFVIAFEGHFYLTDLIIFREQAVKWLYLCILRWPAIEICTIWIYLFTFFSYFSSNSALYWFIF